MMMMIADVRVHGRVILVERSLSRQSGTIGACLRRKQAVPDMEVRGTRIATPEGIP
jgi:hypothetical protein